MFVAAIRSPSGASAELVRRVLLERAVTLATVPLFVEYEAVATRPAALVWRGDAGEGQPGVGRVRPVTPGAEGVTCGTP